MQPETEALIRRALTNPELRQLARRRSRLAWGLSALMAIIYFGFVLTIAYYKELLAQPLFGGVTTVGIPVGIGVILSAFVLTGIYVARANTAFDEQTKKIVEQLKA